VLERIIVPEGDETSTELSGYRINLRVFCILSSILINYDITLPPNVQLLQLELRLKCKLLAQGLLQ
jgi:hypothetical protein